jgi:hypothetical protein
MAYVYQQCTDRNVHSIRSCQVKMYDLRYEFRSQSIDLIFFKRATTRDSFECIKGVRHEVKQAEKRRVSTNVLTFRWSSYRISYDTIFHPINRFIDTIA